MNERKPVGQENAMEAAATRKKTTNKPAKLGRDVQARLGQQPATRQLAEQLDALATLAAVPTARLERALSEFVILGVRTNIAYLLAILRDPVFRAGDATIDLDAMSVERAALAGADEERGSGAVDGVAARHRDDAG